MRALLLSMLMSALAGCASWREATDKSWDSMTLPQAIVTAALILSAALIIAVRIYVDHAYEDDDE